MALGDSLGRLSDSSKNCILPYSTWGSPDGSAVKNLPPMQETQEMQVRSLGREDPLEKETATHSSILAWRIP